MNKKELSKEFKDFVKKFKKYKFNYQYHLNIEIKYYAGIERYLLSEFNYSEVYSSFEKAKNDGIWYLNNEFEHILKKFNELDENRTKEEIIDELYEDDILYYHFSISKLDSYYKDNYVSPNCEEAVIDLEPTQTTYFLDYKGNVKDYEIIYEDINSGVGYSAFLYDGDTDKGAGTKYHYGDLVKSNNWKGTYMIVKHWADTLPQDRRELWMNKYCGVTICDDGTMCDYVDDLFESEVELVKKAEDVVEEANSGNEEMKAWKFLQELFKYYDEINDENWNKFRNGEIIFKTNKSWKDVTIEDILEMNNK